MVELLKPNHMVLANVECRLAIFTVFVFVLVTTEEREQGRESVFGLSTT